MTDIYQGTDLSESHLGREAHDALVGVVAAATVATEVADVIAVAIQAKTHSLTLDLAETLRFRVRILTAATYIPHIAAAFLAVIGTNGAAVTGNSQPQMLVDTDSAGRLDLDVTDVVGATGLTVYLELEPVNRAGSVLVVPLTFD